ncbi:MAG TPA: cupin domain-containing protein [Anaerolineales bacterium]|nr:cupin domain-containing protein [Anaerolineales bacterium]HNA88727.1 cupin domain-containing protein [Anaerolineales bacterium]HNB37371.1 cupin domain-containing protein [Anaerolineales bacterium]HNC09141.1 cupin domain-containing protein [Anaerolineales bacterium]
MADSDFNTPLSTTGVNIKIKKFPGPVIQTGSTGRMDFGPTPLDPSWIIDGNPLARSIPLARAEDANFSCGLWDCQAGKFKFIYSCDELVHILEGEVIVEENGAVHTLRAGDVALFPEGLVTYWTVPKYVKKFAIFRSVREPLLDRVYMKAKKFLMKMLGK